jgi:hypothetical protein
VHTAFQNEKRGIFLSFILLGRDAILRHEEYYGLQDRTETRHPFGKGLDGCEQPKSQLHTCHEGKGVVVRNILDRGITGTVYH